MTPIKRVACGVEVEPNAGLESYHDLDILLQV